MATPSVQVFCRFRPQNDFEDKQHGKICCKTNATNASIDLSYTDKVSDAQNAIFTFDRVFTPAHTQSDIFDRVVAPLVTDALSGFNVSR